MEPGTIIAVGQVSAKVISIIWKYYSDVKDAQDSIRNLRNEVEDIQMVVQKTQELFQNASMAAKLPASALLVKTLEQYLKDMTELETKLDPGAGSKVMKKFGKRALAWPFTKKEVDVWIAKFKTLKDTLNVALNTDQRYAFSSHPGMFKAVCSPGICILLRNNARLRNQ